MLPLNSVPAFYGPEDSLPHSQELSTCPYPESDQFSPHNPILSLQDTSEYYPPTYVKVFLVVSFPPTAYTRYSSPPFVLHSLDHLILHDSIILIMLGEARFS
jgi:hypothetical protein